MANSGASARRYAAIVMQDLDSALVTSIQSRLAEHGLEVIIFPSTGEAAAPISELASAGMLAGVIHFAGTESSHGELGTLRLPRVVVLLLIEGDLHGANDTAAQSGRDMASTLNEARGPLVVIVPRKDLSAAGKTFLRHFTDELSAKAQLITIEAAANSQRISNRAVDELVRMTGGTPAHREGSSLA